MIQAPCHNGKVVSLTLESPLSYPNPEILELEQDVSEATPTVAKKANDIPRLNRIAEGYLPRSHLPTSGGTVRSVVPITAKFQSESALHPAALALLTTLFERGWADPSKLHQDSRRAAILLQEARASFAGILGVTSDDIHFLGDLTLGFHLGIAGLLRPEHVFTHSSVDRQEIFAQSHAHALRGGQTQTLPVHPNGQIDWFSVQSGSIATWQLANGETGVVQHQPPPEGHAYFVDATASGYSHPLPVNWSTALWDSRSWSGPAGLAVLAIGTGAEWRNPLPHLDPLRISDSFSLPLALASAVALEHWKSEEAVREQQLRKIRMEIVAFIRDRITDVDFASDPEQGLTELLSISFLYVDAERLITELEARGFSVDSGSACASLNLQPSHVLAAMGRLTHGNIRLHLRSDLTGESLSAFLTALEEVVKQLRQ